MKQFILIFFVFCLFTSAWAQTDNISVESIEVELPSVIMQNVEYPVNILLLSGGKPVNYTDTLTININNVPRRIGFKNGLATFMYTFLEKQTLSIRYKQATYKQLVSPIPLWYSIIPPLIAILFALLFKEVFVALFIGLLSGTFVIYLYNGVGVISAFFKGIFAIVDEYILQALYNTSHISIIVFSMLIGATVSIITRNGGMQGIVNIILRYARTPRSGQMATWLMGIAIFFDDYANTLVVGSTMRPVTDRLRISREKLAYIVDSTAAPVASVAFVTTWIGAELSYIQDGIRTLGLDANPYQVFFNSLQYAFYPLLTLLFVFLLIRMGRDYGPMLKAERKTRSSGTTDEAKIKQSYSEFEGIEEKSMHKARAYNALIPIGVIILGTMVGLFYTGWDSLVWNNQNIGFATKLSQIIGAADSYKALMWSSLGGVISAIVLSMVQRILTLKQATESMVKGFKTMLTAILILTLAWALALLTENLHTASFISNILHDAAVNPGFLPSITFIVSALVAFSTGTSWGTMAIMYPIILPATWLLSIDYGMDENAAMAIFYNVVSTVIAGSVLGDHCSPISDTTILSSLASSCNHIQHVRTQMPYALTVGTIAVFLGTLPSGFGVPVWILFPIAILLMYLVIRIFGHKTDKQIV